MKDLYKDWESFVPMPHYALLNGALNLASHWPINVLRPDLGTTIYLYHYCCNR